VPLFLSPKLLSVGHIGFNDPCIRCGQDHPATRLTNHRLRTFGHAMLFVGDTGADLTGPGQFKALFGARLRL
jgi:hypothetical protein